MDTASSQVRGLAGSARNLGEGARILEAAAEPPLTLKVNNGLDEVMGRLAKAQEQMDDLSHRLFGDGVESCANTASPLPGDFSGQMGERLHRAIGMSGDLLGTINRLASRL